MVWVAKLAPTGAGYILSMYQPVGGLETTAGDAQRVAGKATFAYRKPTGPAMPGNNAFERLGLLRPLNEPV